MPDSQNERSFTQDAQKTAADAEAAVIGTRRRLAARFFGAIAGHPHTIFAFLAAAAVIVIAFTALRGAEMAFGTDDAIGAVSALATTIINKVFPDPQDAAKAKALLQGADTQAAIQQTASQLQAIIAEAQSADRWTSRARPSFLYVIYCMILASIPMGILYAVDAAHAQGIAQGLQAWLAAIPDALWQLFMVGYLGYTGGRSWEKIKGVAK